MSWLWLFLAIVLEVAATICMKFSDGFTKWIPTGFMTLLYVVSFFPMAVALRRLEVSTAYAVWSAVGTALISIAGVYFFKEALTPAKIGALVMIIGGVIMLHASSAPSKSNIDDTQRAEVREMSRPKLVMISEERPLARAANER